MQSPRARASSPKEVVKEKKTKVNAKVTGSEHQSGKGKSSNGYQNPNKDKECHYCHKKGHLKSDCRQRMKDEKGKGKGGKMSTAAVPQEEPLSATIADESDSLIAGVFNSQHWCWCAHVQQRFRSPCPNKTSSHEIQTCNRYR